MKPGDFAHPALGGFAHPALGGFAIAPQAPFARSPLPRPPSRTRLWGILRFGNRLSEVRPPKGLQGAIGKPPAALVTPLPKRIITLENLTFFGDEHPFNQSLPLWGRWLPAGKDAQVFTQNAAVKRRAGRRMRFALRLRKPPSGGRHM